MTYRPSLSVRLVALAALLLPALAGCDDAVDPTLGTDQAFTVWGYLDPSADQQAIRVVPIADRLNAEEEEQVDAEVTATDVASGEAVAFRDSLVTFEGGTQGHVFVADWTPQFGRTYRLDIRRSNGEVATADVEIPPLVEASIGAAQSSLNDVIYPFSFVGAPNVFGATIELLVTGLPSAPADTSLLSVPFPGARGADDAVAVAFVSTVRRYLSERGLANTGIRLLQAELVAFVANAEWDVPSGRFDDEEAIVEPGTISNVTGGFGFVGGGYFTRTVFVPSANTLIRAGFSASEDAAARIRINEISAGGNWVELYNPLDEFVDITGYSIANTASGGDQRTTLPLNSTIPSRGFLVVDLTFDIEPPATLYFLSGAGREISQRNVEEVPAGFSFGSYPDGRQLVLRIGNDVQDLMGGPVVPSRGQPNVPDVRPVLLNEIYTTGDGWAEVYRPEASDVFLRSVRVLTTDREVLARPALDLPAPGGLAVADESEAAGLVLGQQAGEVFVLAGYTTEADPSASVRYRVVDVRRYGLQTPDRSEGRFPTGGDWREGLAPTRGEPNATSRPL